MKLQTSLQIGKYKSDSIVECEITTDIKKLEDVMQLKLPASCIVGDQSVATASLLNIGDTVVLKAGYDNLLNTEFTGFVKHITRKTTNEIEIDCEDSVYLLRHRSVNQSWKKCSLKQILDAILTNTGCKYTLPIPEINFVNFYIRDATPAQALQKLISDFGLTIYFQSERQLFIGFEGGKRDTKTVKYELGYNVISHSLEDVDSSDTKLKIICKSISKSGEQMTVEVGDGADADKGMPKAKLKKGQKQVTEPKKEAIVGNTETKTLHFWNVQSRDELRKLGIAALRQRKFTGKKGSFKAFLTPYCRAGNVVRWSNSVWSDGGQGDYFVDKVVTTISGDGGRRDIHLGIAIELKE